MHYAHFNLETHQVTVDNTPFKKHSILLGKAEDRNFLIRKVEQITNHENKITASSLQEIYNKLTEIDLMPTMEELWSTAVSLRSATIDRCLCDCHECQNTLKELLQ